MMTYMQSLKPCSMQSGMKNRNQSLRSKNMWRNSAMFSLKLVKSIYMFNVYIVILITKKEKG